MAYELSLESGNKLALLSVTGLAELFGVMILEWRLKTDLFLLRI